MHLKHEVVATFLGIQVYVDKNMVDDSIRPKHVPTRVHSFSSSMSRDCAIMLPSEFHMLTFVVDDVNAVFIHTELCMDSLFIVQPMWNFMATVFGRDSVIHCVLYHDKANALVLGVFDATRLRGVDLSSESIIQRHIKVHEILHQNPHPDVYYHWLGYAQNCLENLHNPNNPFSAHQMLIFGPDCNKRVLANIDTSR